MRFQFGHKYAKGGKRAGAGRPSEEKRKLMAEAVTQWLDKNLKPILTTAELVAIKGVKRRKVHPKSGRIWYEREYDTATLRALLDRVSPAVQRVEQLGKDGRPLVPVTIMAPDFNGIFTPQPEPEPVPPKDEMN